MWACSVLAVSWNSSLGNSQNMLFIWYESANLKQANLTKETSFNFTYVSYKGMCDRQRPLSWGQRHWTAIGIGPRGSCRGSQWRCELTLTHRELTWWLTMWDRCELSVSLLECVCHLPLRKTKHFKNFKLTQWACSEIFVRSSDDSPCSGSSKLTVRLANSRKAHSKLILWVHCELTKCPQNEPTIR